MRETRPMNVPPLKKISIVDLLTFVCLVTLLFLTLAITGDNPFFREAVFEYLLLIASLLVMVGARQGTKNARQFRILASIYPILYIFAIFASICLIQKALNQKTYDHLLFEIDSFLFGVSPFVWIERLFRPWLTDMMFLLYSYYFVMPITLVVSLYIRREYEKLNDFYFVLSFAYYASYFCYILFPAAGPRSHLDHLSLKPLEGVFLAEPIKDLINTLEPYRLDAFPSVHGLIVLLVLIMAYKYHRGLFWVSLPISVGITVSLLYCRYHYAVDVIAGFALAVLYAISALWILRKTRGIFQNHFPR